MEQKRTLWIILASGIFLLVVIGAAVILYAPAMNRNTSARTLRDSGEIWVSPGLSSSTSTYVPPSATADITAPSSDSQSSVTQGLSTPKEGFELETNVFDSSAIAGKESADDTAASVSSSASVSSTNPSITQTDNLTVIANGTTNLIAGTTMIDLNALKNYVPSVSENVTATNHAAEKAIKETENTYRAEEKTMIEKTVQSSQLASVETIDVKKEEPAVSEKKVSSAPKNTTSKTVTSKTTTSKTTTAAKTGTSAPKTSSAKNTSSAKPASKTTQTVSAKTSVPATPDRFWVQAASFTTKKKADEARATLDANKIQCEVFTYKDDKGTLYYRVRVGPYTTKSEAEYWKKRIDAIPEFEKAGSYVTNSTAKAK